MTPKRSESALAKSQADAVHRVVRARISEYPYLAVAAGAGLGFLLAGGLTAHRTRRALTGIGSVVLFSPILSRLIGLGLTVLDPRHS